jgi:hypothetical protein
MTTLLRLTVLTAFLTLVLTWAVGAQTLGSVLGLLATLDLSTLVPADDPALTDPAANESAHNSPPQLPMGGTYFLFGTAKDDLDPQNAFNEVISFDTTDPAAIAGAFRKLGQHVKIGMLTNQVELQYHFVGRTCGGSSPRVQLGISGDGDPTFNQFPGGPDQNAFGYVGDKFFGGGCVPGLWVYEDMTNLNQKWDLSQWTSYGAGLYCGGNAMTCNWTQMVTFFNTEFPNHSVLNVNLVDDAASFFVAGRGCAYFDLFNTGARTITGHADTGGGGNAPNSC